jgi:carboxyl-terminal processing protease
MFRRVWALPLVLLLVTASAVARAEEKSPPSEDYYDLFKVFADTLDQVERNYVKKVDRRELVEAAIQGMISRLDPYSAYIGPEELDRFRSGVESEFGGVGIQITVDGGQLRVLSPISGTPAYRAGVIAGDRIVAIEEQSTEGITVDRAMQQLKGKPGTKVALSVVHPQAGQAQKIVLTREMIHVETVLGDRRLGNDAWDFLYDHDKRIGYIRLTAFSRDTSDELRKALEQLKTAKIRGLILDLRFNPGGLLNQAIEISNLFISQGVIVSTVGRSSPARTWEAHKQGAYEGFPMVILVNRYSASASEIVSACLQDHKRAVIVGERTWGKGSVQNVIEMENGQSLLKLTTSAYKRPSGKNIHRFPNSREADEWGVRPDPGYELRLTDEDLYALIRDRRDRDIIRPHPALAQASAQGATKSKPAPAQESSPPAKAEKPAAKAGDAKPAAKTDGHVPAKPAADKPVRPAVDDEEDVAAAVHGPVADRQLQKALDCLNAEIARAESPAAAQAK